MLYENCIHYPNISKTLHPRPDGAVSPDGRRNKEGRKRGRVEEGRIEQKKEGEVGRKAPMAKVHLLKYT